MRPGHAEQIEVSALPLRDNACCVKIFGGFVDSGPSADFSFVPLLKAG
jgi:hypothetical protein